jgi:hypothetical protein
MWLITATSLILHIVAFIGDVVDYADKLKWGAYDMAVGNSWLPAPTFTNEQ